MITPGTEEFERCLQQLEQTYKRLPNGVATVAVNFSKERFRAQNWIGDRTEPWKARKKGGNWGRSRQSRSDRRAILVKTGRLRRSIRKISANEKEVIIGTDVPYARAHNEGFRGIVTQNVAGHSRKVTKVGIVGRKELKTRSRITFGRVATGDTQNVTAYTRKIKQNLPRRQFIGESPALSRQIERYVNAELIRSLKQ